MTKHLSCERWRKEEIEIGARRDAQWAITVNLTTHLLCEKWRNEEIEIGAKRDAQGTITGK